MADDANGFVGSSVWVDLGLPLSVALGAVEWVRIGALVVVVVLNAALVWIELRRRKQQHQQQHQQQQQQQEDDGAAASEPGSSDENSGMRQRKQRATTGSDDDRSKQSTEDQPLPASKALLVIAHPDDESMFFGPTLQMLRRQGFTTYILCMSTGDFEGKGEHRIRELYAAGASFGIPPPRIHIIDDPQLQDGPQNVWKADAIAAHVCRYAAQHAITKLITFDEQGASWHPNHIAVHDGVAAAATRNSDLVVYCLESVPLVRKYIGAFDFLFAFWKQRLALVSLSDWLHIQAAMGAHASQLVWYRRLSMLFSRFVYINSLTQLHR